MLIYVGMGAKEVPVFGLRFDFPELAVVFLALISYIMLGSQLGSAMVLAVGFALVLMYRS